MREAHPAGIVHGQPEDFLRIRAPPFRGTDQVADPLSQAAFELPVGPVLRQRPPQPGRWARPPVNVA